MAMPLLNDAVGAAWTVQKATAGTQSWLPNYVVRTNDYVNSPPTRQDLTVAQRPAP